MILVSACYTVSDLPLNVYYLMLNVHGDLTLYESGWYASLFISFFYFCANPFIYATKFDPVKEILARMIPCRKTAVQPIESIEITASRVTGTGTVQTHK